MGPTTAALLRFFRADQALHAAQERLDAATRTVRGQGSKVEQLRAQHDAATRKGTEIAAKVKELELELKTREQRIELLRERQQNATVPKEYQALIVEINTHKLDKGKFEEQALKQMDAAAANATAAGELRTTLEAEQGKFDKMNGEVDARVRELTAEVQRLKGPRDEMAAQLPHAAVAVYQRAAERYDGEAMAPIEKPDPRDMEYLCAGCNTYLVANVYNRLMSSKDEVVLCPSCSRVLYVPEDLTPELALQKKAARGDAKPKKAPKAAAAAGEGAAEKPKRASRAKKGAVAAGKGAEPGSLAAALAAGALAASGKGPKATETRTIAPLPSRADGTANVSDTADAPPAPRQPNRDDATAEANTPAANTPDAGTDAAAAAAPSPTPDAPANPEQAAADPAAADAGDAAESAESDVVASKSE